MLRDKKAFRQKPRPGAAAGPRSGECDRGDDEICRKLPKKRPTNHCTGRPNGAKKKNSAREGKVNARAAISGQTTKNSRRRNRKHGVF